MNKVYLLIGGNLDNRFNLLETATKKISNKIGPVLKVSSIYETAPWGFEAEQNFLNRVVVVSTEFSPNVLLSKCLEIESEMGRVRVPGEYASRTMDVDILFFNDEVIHEKDLVIPHERLHERKFTLEPLVELDPDFVHPVFKKSLTKLLLECEDNSEVVRL